MANPFFPVPHSLETEFAMAYRSCLTWMTASVLLAIAAAPTIAQSSDRVPGALKRVGALHCTASRAEDAATTRLDCRLRLADVEVEQGRFEGVLYGEGLYLVEPGQVRTIWNVLAPTRSLEPSAIEGDYDIVSKHAFAYAEDRPNLLMGGMDDVVGLELMVPRVDPIKPSTRLTLRRAD